MRCDTTAGEMQRMTAGQQHIQQHAELIDVGRGGGHVAEQLLGRCVLGRQHDLFGARRRGVVGCALRIHELRDAEVEQLDHAVARHEHVRRLEVAMNDQLAVRVRYGRNCVDEQPHARFDAERVRSTVVIDALAVDVLQHQELVAVVGRASVEQARDVRMAEPREQAAFVTEAICDSRSGDEPVEELDGAAAFEPPVAARGEPNLAHAAAADQPIERVRADLLARERQGDGACVSSAISLRRILQEAGCIQRIALGEQIAQRCRDQRLRRGEIRQPALAFVGLEVERPIQVTAELAPQRWIEGRQAHTTAEV